MSNLISVRSFSVAIVVAVVLSASVFIGTTSIASAQATGLVPCSGLDCTTCNFADLANTIIKILFGAVALIFGVMMLVSGFGLVTSGGNPAALNDAKSKFTNALIGLLIMMSAWLIVDTLMRTLLKGDDGVIEGWGPWSEIQCKKQTEPETYRGTGDGTDAGDIVPPPVPPPVAPGTYTHAQALTALGGSFTVVSSESCSDKTKTYCTSLDGVRINTINRLKAFQAAVGIPLVITGGTEVGHAGGTYSHANGYKIDLRVNDTLNNYITTNFTSIGGSKWRDPNGNIYYRHGPPDHWDIAFIF